MQALHSSHFIATSTSVIPTTSKNVDDNKLNNTNNFLFSHLFSNFSMLSTITVSSQHYNNSSLQNNTNVSSLSLSAELLKSQLVSKFIF